MLGHWVLDAGNIFYYPFSFIFTTRFPTCSPVLFALPLSFAFISRSTLNSLHFLPCIFLSHSSTIFFVTFRFFTVLIYSTSAFVHHTPPSTSLFPTTSSSFQLSLPFHLLFPSSPLPFFHLPSYYLFFYSPSFIRLPLPVPIIFPSPYSSLRLQFVIHSLLFDLLFFFLFSSLTSSIQFPLPFSFLFPSTFSLFSFLHIPLRHPRLFPLLAPRISPSFYNNAHIINCNALISTQALVHRLPYDAKPANVSRYTCSRETYVLLSCVVPA